MLVQQMARQVAAHGGLGLAMPVFTQMLRMQEKTGQKAGKKEPA
jgi:Rod binding domain-containing protein